MTPAELRTAGIAAIGTKTGAAAIDALISAGLFPRSTEDRQALLSDETQGGIRTVRWQNQERHATDWRPAT